MKTRTHHESARRVRPAEWTCDDAEAARMQANQTARPWVLREPTPEAWTKTDSISSRHAIPSGTPPPATRRVAECLCPAQNRVFW